MNSLAEIRHELSARLADARARTDALFSLLKPEAWRERPIPERHRNIFYLGHLEAFDSNMVCRTALGRDSFNEEFDRQFAFGIDPTDGKLPDDQPGDWPPVGEIQRYNRGVRMAVDECLNEASTREPRSPLLQNGLIFEVVIEHRLMHAETFTYMLHQLPLEQKRPPLVGVPPPRPSVAPRMVEIPPGTATLGARSKGSPGAPFGWDNEFEQQTVTVPSFSIDAYNVTNGQFLEFIQSGGYEDRALWTAADWDWVSHQQLRHPKFWRRSGNVWTYRSMFSEIPLCLDWPVYVSHAEASAYARWDGKALPTEAQWHRAALGTPEGRERAFPWGHEYPRPQHGNYDFVSWDPTPVGTHSAGNSAFGVADLAGNGWEWTSTPFGPLPGFEPFSFYPGYSADFFDRKHFVLKGASPRTAACFLRRSFRNWFQPHYPYPYATFRCVEN